MSYQNGHASHEAALREESRHSAILEELATDAEFQRVCMAYDPQLAAIRDTDQTFEWGGVKRVTLRLIGRGRTSAALTFEVVPDGMYFKEERSEKLALSAGSKVKVEGKDHFLDRPIIFRRRA